MKYVNAIALSLIIVVIGWTVYEYKALEYGYYNWMSTAYSLYNVSQRQTEFTKKLNDEVIKVICKMHPEGVTALVKRGKVRPSEKPLTKATAEYVTDGNIGMGTFDAQNNDMFEYFYCTEEQFGSSTQGYFIDLTK